MIARIIDILGGPLVRLAVVPTLTATAVWAAQADPQFPQEGQRWFLSVRAPDAPGRTRFARIYGDPVDGRWAVTVTCGTSSLRTGQERTRVALHPPTSHVLAEAHQAVVGVSEATRDKRSAPRDSLQ